MAYKKIRDAADIGTLTGAEQLETDNGTNIYYKTTPIEIGAYTNTNQTFSALNSTSKTITGAINEVISGKFDKTGGTISGSANVQGSVTFGTGLSDGTTTITLFDTDPTLAANSDGHLSTQKAIKAYIAEVLQTAQLGLQPKSEVACATNASITLSGEQNIDGFVTSISRVLVKNQLDPTQNGIYVSGSGAWARATDSNTGALLFHGLMYVQNGTTHGDETWYNTNSSEIIIGTTSITYAVFSKVSILHNSLLSIQGGTAGEYYHNTSSVNSALTGAANALTASNVAVDTTTMTNALANKEAEISTTTTFYVDSNRIDSYTADGTINRPYKTLGAAVSAIVGDTVINMAPGTYAETGTVTIPNYKITIFGNGAALNVTGNIVINTPYYTRYNLFSTISGSVSYSNPAAGARCLMYGGSIVGNISINSYAEFVQCQLTGGAVTVNATGTCLASICSPTSRFLSVGTLILTRININTSYSGYLITSTSGQLILADCLVYNTGTGGCISCVNGATTIPNIITNNIISSAAGTAINNGAAITVYSKNFVVGTVTSTGFIPVNSDITGGGNIMGLGSDAAYDTYYRASTGLLTRLAPNTITTKKWFSMTGTGSAGATPAWSAVTSTDVGLGNVENIALSTWGGSSNITTVGILSLPNTSAAVTQAAGEATTRIATDEFVMRTKPNHLIAEVACATTANITLSGEQAIDGFTTSTSRVLVKDQSTQTQNGVYVSGSGAWTRATDSDAAEEIQYASMSIANGTINVGSVWYNTNSSAITIGTTNITYAKWAGISSYSSIYATLAGNQTFTGTNTFSVTPKITTLTPGQLVGANASYGLTSFNFIPSATTATTPAVGINSTLVATAAYVDRTAPLHYVDPVDCVATSNIAIFSGEQTIDGFTTSNSRVLVIGQTNFPYTNGVYLSSSGGWNRASDSNTVEEIQHAAMQVKYGALNAGKVYVNTNMSQITLGTTTITYAEWLTNSASDIAAAMHSAASVDCVATANITLSGEHTLDGFTTSASRVLVIGQTTQSQNGIYTTASGAWTRATDSDLPEEIQRAAIQVKYGAQNGGKVYINANSSPITIGSTAIIYIEWLLNSTLRKLACDSAVTNTGNYSVAMSSSGSSSITGANSVLIGGIGATIANAGCVVIGDQTYTNTTTADNSFIAAFKGGLSFKYGDTGASYATMTLASTGLAKIYTNNSSGNSYSTLSIHNYDNAVETGGYYGLSLAQEYTGDIWMEWRLMSGGATIARYYAGIDNSDSDEWKFCATGISSPSISTDWAFSVDQNRCMAYHKSSFYLAQLATDGIVTPQEWAGNGHLGRLLFDIAWSANGSATSYIFTWTPVLHRGYLVKISFMAGNVASTGGGSAYAYSYQEITHPCYYSTLGAVLGTVYPISYAQNANVGGTIAVSITNAGTTFSITHANGLSAVECRAKIEIIGVTVNSY